MRSERATLRKSRETSVVIMTETQHSPWSVRKILMLVCLFLVYFVVFAAYSVYTPFFPSEVSMTFMSIIHLTETLKNIDCEIRIVDYGLGIKHKFTWLGLSTGIHCRVNSLIHYYVLSLVLAAHVLIERQPVVWGG